MKLINSWLILIILIFAGGNAFCQVSGNITANQKTARDIFAELIGIKTTVNMGSTKAAEAMAVRLVSVGFAQGDVIVAGIATDTAAANRLAKISPFYQDCLQMSMTSGLTARMNG